MILSTLSSFKLSMLYADVSITMTNLGDPRTYKKAGAGGGGCSHRKRFCNFLQEDFCN